MEEKYLQGKQKAGVNPVKDSCYQRGGGQARNWGLKFFQSLSLCDVRKRKLRREKKGMSSAMWNKISPKYRNMWCHSGEKGKASPHKLFTQ